MFVFSHTFSVLLKSTFDMFWELHGFLFHMKYLRNPWIWNVFVFSNFSCTIEIQFSHVLGIAWNSASRKIFQKPVTLECLCFPTLFLYNGNQLYPSFRNCVDFPMFWELYAFLFNPKYFRNPWNWNVCVLQYIYRTLEIHFPHVFGIAWISPCFRNCMDFCVTQNISENHEFEMFMFSHSFPVLSKSILHMFWELYGFLFHPKYLRNPWIWNVCVFPYFSHTMQIYFSHALGIVWISASRKIFEKAITLEFLCFPHFSCTTEIHFQQVQELYGFPVFWELYRFLFHPKYLKNSQIWNVCVTKCFSLTKEIHFLYVLGILWISDSPKLFKKSINLKCVCFLILFQYYGSPLYPCFENCMDFCFTQNI